MSRLPTKQEAYIQTVLEKISQERDLSKISPLSFRDLEVARLRLQYTSDTDSPDTIKKGFLALLQELQSEQELR